MNDDTVLDLLRETAEAVEQAMAAIGEWGLAGTRPGQHHSDIAADAAAIEVLERAGVGVLSEESGGRRLDAIDDDGGLVVVLDPLDGSTNAAQGIPWFATSMCAVDRDGPRAAVVADLPRRRTFSAVRGAGAHLDGVAIVPGTARTPGDAFVALSGYPPRHLGWRQYRALGAIALDLCAVASGVLDAVVDCSTDAHGVWDYLAGALICREAGAVVADAADRDLVVLDPDARRTPVAAATSELHEALTEARRSWTVSDSQPSRRHRPLT